MPRLAETRAGLLQQEIDALQRAGYSVTGSDEVHDMWTLRVEAPAEKTGAEPVHLDVFLPASYPLTPPIVRAPDLGMRHHQNPVNGELCLLARPSLNWKPEWHVHGLLDRQLALTIATGRADYAGTDVEEDQGEPATYYYKYEDDAGALIDTATLARVTSGHGTFRYRLAITPSPGADTFRTFVVVERIDLPAAPPADSPDELGMALWPFPAGSGIGQWVYLDGPPALHTADQVWRDTTPKKGKTTRVTGSDGTTYDVRLLVFPEEHAHRDEGPGCVVLLRTTPPPNPSIRFVPPKTSFVKSFRAGRDDLLHRAPETAGMPGKKVVLVGAGAVGSPVAVHLARAGLGRLTVIDKDVVEPGNLARHATTIGLVAVGKAQATCFAAMQANPYLHARHLNMPIGSNALPAPDTPSASALLAEAFADADLVIDATADTSVQQYTSEVARETGTTWICVDATPGIGGGTIVTIHADRDACYACFLWRQHLPPEPSPPPPIRPIV